MEISVIIFFVVNILLLCILAIFCKRVTIPAGIAVQLIVGLLSILLFDFVKTPWFIFFVPVCIGGFVGLKYKFFPTLDYNKRIFSLAPFKDSKQGRMVGKCFPYYKKQLKYNHSTIRQSELAMSGGTILTGSSGSGKTYYLVTSIAQDLAAGKSTVFIDFKGDVDTLNKLEEVAGNVKVYKLTWEECNFTYDPLINLDEAGRVEAILNMRKWDLSGSDEHYRTGTQLFLQKTIHEYQHTEGNYLIGYYKFLQQYNVGREMYEAYNTVIKLIELTVSSKVRGMFSNGQNQFSFTSNEQFLLMVSFTSATKALGTSITSLLLTDLMEVGTRNAYAPALSLNIDEFGSCQNPLLVKDILEKGRSCGIQTLISMQDINQLIINTNEPFLDSVLGTTNNFIVFGGSTRNTAEKLAGTQIYEIETLLMSLKKPLNGKPPTAIFISKYPIFGKGGTEVYRFIPTVSIGKNKLNNTPEVQQKNITKQSTQVNNFEQGINQFEGEIQRQQPQFEEAQQFQQQQIANEKSKEQETLVSPTAEDFL